MTDGEEDFATMFEASLKAKRYKRGQTIEMNLAGFTFMGDRYTVFDCPGSSEFAGGRPTLARGRKRSRQAQHKTHG